LQVENQKLTQTLYRQQAIDAADRLDHLPKTIRVAGSMARLLGALLAAFLIGAVAASFFIHVPIRLNGHGMLVDSTGELTVPVVIPVQGYVESVAVRIGESVKEGQKLAILRIPDKEIALGNARRALDEAVRAAGENSRLRSLDEAAETRSFQKNRSAARDQVESQRDKVTWLDRRVRDLEQLAAKGYASRQSTIEAQLKFEEGVASLLEAEANVVALETKREEAASARKREAAADQMRIDRARDALLMLEAERSSTTQITAPSAGQVSAIDAQAGELVSAGGRLIELLKTGKRENKLEVLAFVPLNEGKRIRRGDRALVAPSSLAKSSHDRLIGRVSNVSDAPASDKTMTNLLGSADLVRDVAASGPPFIVTVSLETDKAGQYAWTSGGVAPRPLSLGTPVAVDITIDRPPLIALVLPALKKLLGIKTDAWSGLRQ
jgi:NHLM bacteriocin system secretion protein